MKVFDSLLQQLVPILVDVLLKLLFAVLIYFIGSKLIKIVLNIWKKSKGYEKIDYDAAQFLTSVINITLRILLFASVVMILGIPTSSIIAALGSAGLAIGLALQGGLSNFAGGVILLITKPFQTGDFIVVGSESGTVTSIDIFYTNLTTPDNCSVVIPNGVITNSPIINKSKFDTRRIDLLFSVEYEADIEKVKGILLEVADKNEFVLKDDKKPFTSVSAYADSSVNVLLRVWCKNSEYWDATFSLQEEVKRAFDENSITIPFPQVEITEKKK